MSARKRHGTTSPEAMHPAYRKVFLRIVPLIMLMYLLAWMDRVSIGFAALTMNKDLGITATNFGLGAALFFVGYFFFEVPSNVIMEKVGARVWLARIMVTWGLVAAATAFVVGEYSFYAARTLLGIAEAGFFPGVLLYLTYWVPRAVRGRITALFIMAAPIASAIGAPLASLVLTQLDGAFGLRSWQVLFLLLGVATVLVGVLVFWLLPSRPAEAAWLSDSERRFIEGELERERAETPDAPHQSKLSVLKSPQVLALALIFFGINAGGYLLNFFLPQVIRALDSGTGTEIPTMRVGLLTAIPWVTAVAVMYFGARHSDRTGERVWHVFTGAVVSACALAAAPLVGNAVAAIVLLSVAAAGLYVAMPLFWQLPQRFLSATTIAAGIALINSIGNLSGFVGPYATGALYDATGSFTGGMVFVSVLVLIAALALVALHRAGARAVTPGESRTEQSRR
ncbi:MFS transporter [Streptomyces sp. NPDC042319]|uniref:MFS transporter n=1 Tax=Streptomyces sp. NPDC042319 TaxID=3154332 RepID=UPI0033C0927E